MNNIGIAGLSLTVPSSIGRPDQISYSPKSDPRLVVNRCDFEAVWDLIYRAVDLPGISLLQKTVDK